MFFFAAILSYTDRLILNLLVDPIRGDLGITDTQISLLQGAAFAVIYSIAGLPMGRYADRHNRRNLIVTGIVLWSLATAACGLATSFGALFAARIMVGIGEAMLSPAVISMIPDYFPPERRGTAVGIYVTGIIMGGGTAVVIGGTALGVLEGHALFGDLPAWRSVLLLLSLPGVLLATVMLTVREPERTDRLMTAEELGRHSHVKVAYSYFSANRATFVLLFGGLTLMSVVNYGVTSWLPALLSRVHSMPPSQIGAMLGGTMLAAGGLGALLGGLAADALQRAGRTDAKARVVAYALAAAVPTLAFALLGEPKLVLGLFAAYALLASMAATSGIAAVQDVVPSELRGFATSVQAFLYTLVGLGTGPTLVAVVTDRVMGDPLRVGAAIASVGFPLMLAGVVMLMFSLAPFRTTRRSLLANAQA